MKGFLAGFGVIAIILSMIALSIGGVVLAYGVDWFTAPFKGAQDARQIIQSDGQFRLQAYDSFYNQCASIQALERDIDAAILGLKVATVENDQRILRQTVTNISGARDGAIARYNTESHKQWTVAQFKSTALVYEIPTTTYVTVSEGEFKAGVKTTCVVQ